MMPPFEQSYKVDSVIERGVVYWLHLRLSRAYAFPAP